MKHKKLFSLIAALGVTASLGTSALAAGTIATYDAATIAAGVQAENAVNSAVINSYGITADTTNNIWSIVPVDEYLNTRLLRFTTRDATKKAEIPLMGLDFTKYNVNSQKLEDLNKDGYIIETEAALVYRSTKYVSYIISGDTGTIAEFRFAPNQKYDKYAAGIKGKISAVDSTGTSIGTTTCDDNIILNSTETSGAPGQLQRVTTEIDMKHKTYSAYIAIPDNSNNYTNSTKYTIVENAKFNTSDVTKITNIQYTIHSDLNYAPGSTLGLFLRSASVSEYTPEPKVVAEVNGTGTLFDNAEGGDHAIAYTATFNATKTPQTISKATWKLVNNNDETTAKKYDVDLKGETTITDAEVVFGLVVSNVPNDVTSDAIPTAALTILD